VYGTAKILLLSGIGPQSHLNEMGIEVIRDLPVGRSFTARPVAITLFTGNGMTDPSVVSPYMFNAILDPSTPIGAAALAQWVQSGTGGLAISGASVLGSPIISANEETPNYIMHFSDMLPPLTGSIDERCVPAAFQNFPPVTELPGANSVFCVLAHPRSRAQIKLNSADPTVPIYFAPNFFSVQEDVDDLVACLERLRGLTGADPTPPSGIYGVSADPVHYPSSAFRPYRGAEFFPGIGTDLDNYVRTCSHSAYHVFGSTPLGANPILSVVDPRLVVHGTTNLRIADAGVIIDVSSGPYSVTHMVGERCADFIIRLHHL
jgi:choline dehydrogenase